MYSKKDAQLMILKVLEEYTDSHHYLTQQEIIDKIEAQYDIVFNRKTISFNIASLIKFDYDIIQEPRKGYALVSRLFDSSESKYLIDAIFSSKSITKSQTKRMVDSIVKCLSVYERKTYNYIYKSEELIKSNNTVLFHNIETIHEAISKRKRLEFKYLEYDSNGNLVPKLDGYVFNVSPYYLVNNYGNYYLVCHYRDKYGAITTYRIEYMKDVKIYEKDDHQYKELSNFIVGFDISKYLNEHIYLFHSQVIDAEIEIVEPYGVMHLYEWFGKNAKIIEKNGKLIAKVKCDEMALFYWIMQYSHDYKVLSPSSLVDKIKVEIDNLSKKYL